MISREKVIKGLECLTQRKEPTANPCKDCGYINRPNFSFCVKDIASDALELLKEKESEWLEDSDPGQEYGTTWACRKCMHSIHKPYVWNPYDSGYKYCPFCGDRMVLKLDD